jgi:hypothetical protein
MVRQKKSLYLDDDVIAIVTKIANVTGKSMSQTVNDAIRQLKNDEEAREAGAGTLRQIRQMIRREAKRISTQSVCRIPQNVSQVARINPILIELPGHKYTLAEGEQ